MSGIFEFRFHIGDFLTGTIQMDATEVGAYIQLIIAHMQAGVGGLRDDDEMLARISKVTPHVWKSRIRRSVLEAKFNKISTEDGDFWVQERAVDNLKKITKLSSEKNDKSLKDKDGASDKPSNHQTFNQRFKHQASLSLATGARGDGDGEPYSPWPFLTDDEQQECRAAAPGWEMSVLVGVFVEGIRTGKREMPRNPQKPFKYFIQFLRSYTKGKRP